MEMLAQAIKDANASMARDQGSDQGSDQGEDVFGAPVIAGCRMEHPCRRRFLQAAVNLKYLPESGEQLTVLVQHSLLGEVILRANEGRSVGELFNE